ncbi:hypothetical protein ABID29_000206 [Streptococcus rupicaprae]|uniref:Uncharacterized protein n=1 Tax=Streptococcus rupicaprae TaxID=759619 RepID=A0ABV2FEV9_9STRE
MIKWNYFPRNKKIDKKFKDIIRVFEHHTNRIDSSYHKLASNVVLEILRQDLEALGYQVEKGKKKDELIRIPVLFGENGIERVSYEVDAFHSEEKTVIEVEAGRAVTNYQFLKDFFECCMMYDVDYLCIAVRNTYLKSNDFKKVSDFFDSLYTSNRVSIPLQGVLIIGY